MDDKNLHPAMIGKLAKENQQLTDQLNKDDDNGNA